VLNLSARIAMLCLNLLNASESVSCQKENLLNIFIFFGNKLSSCHEGKEVMLLEVA
jgi:hypothetical protein